MFLFCYLWEVPIAGSIPVDDLSFFIIDYKIGLTVNYKFLVPRNSGNVSLISLYLGECPRMGVSRSLGLLRAKPIIYYFVKHEMV